MEVQSARIGRSTTPHTSPSEREQTETTSPGSQTNDAEELTNDSLTVTAVTPDKADSLEKAKDMDGSGETKETPRSSSPPNPFDESDDEEDTKTPAKSTTNGDLTCTPVTHHEDASRPVPAPRRVSEPTLPPRPAPRVRLLRAADGWYLLTAES